MGPACQLLIRTESVRDVGLEGIERLVVVVSDETEDAEVLTLERTERVGSGTYRAPASWGKGANGGGEAPGSTGTNGSGGGGLQRLLGLRSSTSSPATRAQLLLLFCYF